MADNGFDPMNPLGNPNLILDLGLGPQFFPNSGKFPFFLGNDNIPAKTFSDTVREIIENAIPSGDTPDLSTEAKLVDFVQDWINKGIGSKPKEGMAAFRKENPDFIGYFQGYPVYLDRKTAGSAQGYTDNDSEIYLNPLMFAPVGDVVRHEHGHALALQMFPETDKAGKMYSNVMDALEEATMRFARNPSAETLEASNKAFRAYRETPQEQAANWFSGMFGSWSNDPTENPRLVNILFDEFTRLARQNEEIENMFKTPAAAPKKTAGQVP